MLRVDHARWGQTPEDLRHLALSAPQARTRERALALLDITQHSCATLPPISFPGRPERWRSDEALKAEADPPQATLEQRHQAAGDILAVRCRCFFSTGVLFSVASHSPVETAQ